LRIVERQLDKEQRKVEAERQRRERAEQDLKEKGNDAEFHEAQFYELSYRARPLQDVVAVMDKLLLLDKHSLITERCNHTHMAYRDEGLRKEPSPPFPPMGKPFIVDARTTPLSYKIVEASEFVKKFKSLYKTKAPALLDYMKDCFSEFSNSEPPAAGFERRVWSTCCKWECNAAGKCSQGLPFKKDFWNKPADVGAMPPADKLHLFAELLQGGKIENFVAKKVSGAYLKYLPD